jgi:hypothetical protein
MLGIGHNNILGNRVIDDCNEFIKDISGYFLKDKEYVNNMGWMVINGEKNNNGTCTKIVATGLETCMATGQKVYECILF